MCKNKVLIKVKSINISLKHKFTTELCLCRQFSSEVRAFLYKNHESKIWQKKDYWNDKNVK